MSHQVHCICATAEIREAVHQMDEAYGTAFVRSLSATRFSGFSELCILLSIYHPAGGVPKKLGRGSYSKSTGSYLISQQLDYADWITSDWSQRTFGYARSVKEAIGRIAKTRLMDNERAALLIHADQVAEEVARRPPETVIALEPAYFAYSDDGGRPGLHFGKIDGLGIFTPPGRRYVEIPPEDAFAAAQSLPPRPDNDLPGLLRLYKRDGDTLHFYEAFPYEGQIAEHWGIAGVGGDNRFHDYRSAAHARSLVAGFKKAQQAEGFRSIPPSRQHKLIVEYDVQESFANPEELDFRHAAEDALHDLLGRTGLGHFDGGSSGQGTMEICLIVVDVKLAEKAVREGLADTPFGNIQRIYVER